MDSRSTTSMTTPATLSMALQPLIESITAFGIPYFIGGSVASSAYGLARATLDVDLVADIREEHVDLLVGRWHGACYIDAGMIRRGPTGSSKVLRCQSGLFADTGEHPWADFIALMKGEYHIRPSRP